MEEARDPAFDEETIQRLNPRRQKMLQEQEFRETERQFQSSNRWKKVWALAFFTLLVCMFAACWALAVYYAVE